MGFKKEIVDLMREEVANTHTQLACITSKLNESSARIMGLELLAAEDHRVGSHGDTASYRSLLNTLMIGQIEILLDLQKYLLDLMYLRKHQLE